MHLTEIIREVRALAGWLLSLRSSRPLLFSGIEGVPSNLSFPSVDFFLVNLTKNKVLYQQYVCTLVDVKIVKDEG